MNKFINSMVIIGTGIEMCSCNTGEVLGKIEGIHTAACNWMQSRYEANQFDVVTRTFENIETQVTIQQGSGRYQIEASAEASDVNENVWQLSLTSYFNSSDKMKNNPIEESASHVFMAAEWEYANLDCSHPDDVNCRFFRWPGRVVYSVPKNDTKAERFGLREIRGTMNRLHDNRATLKYLAYNCRVVRSVPLPKK